MAARDRDKIFELVTIKKTPPSPTSNEVPSPTLQDSTEGYKRIITSSAVVPGGSGAGGGSQSNGSQKLTASDSSTVFANNMLAEVVDLGEDSSMVTSNAYSQDFLTANLKKATDKRVLCAWLLVVGIILLVVLVAIAGLVLAALNRIGYQDSSGDIASLQQTSQLNYTALMQMTALQFMQVSDHFDQILQNVSLLGDEANLAAENQRSSVGTLNVTLLGLLISLQELKASLNVLQNNITYLQSDKESLAGRIDSLANQAYTPPTCSPATIESFSNGLSEISTDRLLLVSLIHVILLNYIFILNF